MPGRRSPFEVGQNKGPASATFAPAGFPAFRTDWSPKVRGAGGGRATFGGRTTRRAATPTWRRRGGWPRCPHRIETVNGQLAERYDVSRTWAKDLWRLCHRVLRKVLSHTVLGPGAGDPHRRPAVAIRPPPAGRVKLTYGLGYAPPPSGAENSTPSNGIPSIVASGFIPWPAPRGPGRSGRCRGRRSRAASTCCSPGSDRASGASRGSNPLSPPS